MDRQRWLGYASRTLRGRNLAANPAICVHLESGDDVVIFEGVAEEVAEPGTLAAIDAAYRAKYGMGVGEAPDGAAWYTLRPSAAHAWLESDLVRTATHWSFGKGEATESA